MTDTLHEYVVLEATGEFESKVEVGQSLLYPSYWGKEHTWEFVNMKTMEPTGTITGLHRRKTTRKEIERGADT